MGWAGVGQGVSAGINANSQINQQDAQTALALQALIAAKRGNAAQPFAGQGMYELLNMIKARQQPGPLGPPPPPGMAQPPMPGTQSMPMQPPGPPGVSVQPLPNPDPMMGTPLPPGGDVALPPYRPISGATLDQNGFNGSLEDVTPTGEGPYGPGVAVGAPVNAVTSNDREAPAPPVAPAAMPGAAGPAAAAAAPAAAPAIVPGKVPTLAASPDPKQNQLSQDMDAMDLVRALQKVGTPPELVISALNQMSPTYGLEYKASIAAHKATIDTYKAVIDAGRLSEQTRNHDLIESRKRDEEAGRNARAEERNALLDKRWATQHEDRLKALEIAAKRVEVSAKKNSPEATSFKYLHGLFRAANTQLMNLRTQQGLQTSAEGKLAYDAQIRAVQDQLDIYAAQLTRTYNEISGRDVGTQSGETNAEVPGVPVPPKKAAAKSGAGKRFVYDPASGTVKEQ